MPGVVIPCLPFLFSHLAQLDEPTSFLPHRYVILAQYQKEAGSFYSSPTWSAIIKSHVPTQEAVRTSPTYSSLPTKPTLIGGGLDSVNKLLHDFLPKFTAFSPLKNKRLSRFGSGICPLALPNSEAGKILDIVLKSIIFRLGQTWFKMLATLPTL